MTKQELDEVSEFMSGAKTMIPKIIEEIEALQSQIKCLELEREKVESLNDCVKRLEKENQELRGRTGGMNIVEKLDDLIKQATTERSHYYVRSVALEAKQEISKLYSGLEVCKEALGAILEVRAFYKRCFGDEIVGKFGEIIAWADDVARAALDRLKEGE